MQLTKEHKRKKFLLEIKDMLAGSAFPLMIQLIFSASIILFADYSGEAGIQIAALVFGEILLIGAYIIFGRQSGITAYRRTAQYNKKLELFSGDLNAFHNAEVKARGGDDNDLKAFYATGAYALYKGFLMGLISTVPFIIVQLIHCVAPNLVCEFILKYAFGWAYYPFFVIGKNSSGTLSQWLNYIWIILPVAIHGVAYYIGARGEKVRQQKVKEAQEIKEKCRK